MYIRAYSDPFYISWNNACTARYGVDIHSVTEWEGEGRGEGRRGEERERKESNSQNGILLQYIKI